MNSRERIQRAMELGEADRVPVMCQLSIGHYFLHSAADPLSIWFTSEGFAEALIQLQRRYGFDGILINLPGREPGWEKHVQAMDRQESESIVRWKNGRYTVIPADDNPHYYQPDGTRFFPRFEEIDPERLFYVEPWDLTEITYPYTWGFEPEPRPFNEFFPAWHGDTIRAVQAAAGQEISVHSEVFSPWSQFLELLNYENALMAMVDDPGKVEACLERLTAGAVTLGQSQALSGVDAVLISSAFAGGGLISRQHYQEFVLPYEKAVVAGVKAARDVPVYTHTCGSIGDRLDLILETGTNGIDTLDPPPLGTVELEEAKRMLQGRAFIKGNIDPVHTLLYGTRETVQKDVEYRIRIGRKGGGYILSSACSIAPATPPENIEQLRPLAERWGRY